MNNRVFHNLLTGIESQSLISGTVSARDELVFFVNCLFGVSFIKCISQMKATNPANNTMSVSHRGPLCYKRVSFRLKYTTEYSKVLWI